MTRVLDRRTLNRATLERQLLLSRCQRPVTEVVEHLVGLQAQTPHTWYTGLWTRIAGFQPDHAADLLIERGLVRLALMRGTIHLVTAADCHGLRTVVQPVLDRWLHTQYGKNLVGLDREELVAAARALLDERPLTFAELGNQLAERFCGYDPSSLAQAVRGLVALVQVPPRGVWGRSGPIAHATAEAWLGAKVNSPLLTLQRMLAS